MRWLDWFHAARYWRLQPFRAGLSGLGIVCGIAGLVMAVAIGEGVQKRISEAISLLGSGMLVVHDISGNDSAPQLTSARVEKLRRLLAPYSEGIAPLVSLQRSVGADRRLDNVRIIGTGSDYGRIFSLRVQQGRMLSDYDVLHAQRVCVVGASIGRRLFNSRNVIGRYLRIGDEWCRVVGWLAPNPLVVAGSLKEYQLPDIDNVVYLPYSTVLSDSSGNGVLNEVEIRLRNEGQLTAAERLIHKSFVSRGAHNDLEIVLPVQILKQKNHMQLLMRRALLGIATILLLVGGVGVMNVMLVSVASRFPEIGLRRSLGASRHDVIRQFITEALVLTIAAGFAGVVIGTVLTVLLASFTSWTVSLNLNAAIIGLVISLVAGVLFGTYPAYKASVISPVRALRA